MVEYIAHCFADERTVHHEFSIDSMQYCFQAVPFPWVLRIEELKQPYDECVVKIFLSYLCIQR